MRRSRRWSRNQALQEEQEVEEQIRPCRRRNRRWSMMSGTAGGGVGVGVGADQALQEKEHEVE